MTSPRKLDEIVVVTSAPIEQAELAVEFPTVRITRAVGVASPVILDLEDFLSAPSFAPFDEALEAWSRGGDPVLVLRGERDVTRGAMQVLTRYQRFVERSMTHLAPRSSRAFGTPTARSTICGSRS